MTNEILKKYGSDPIKLFQSWLTEATQSEPNDPEAICLATVDAQGRPGARMVLLKEISEHGFKFHTNASSNKGQAIAVNQQVSFCLYWKSTRKQIRVEGTCTPVSTEESDEYFKTRPRERAIGAWASHQSHPYEHREVLNSAIERYTKQFEGVNEIPRPPEWQGYRIAPTSIEFWIGHEARLHTRFIYKKEGGNWQASWLYP